MSSADAALAALREALGEGVFAASPGLEIDGVEPATVLRPVDTAGLSEGLRALAKHGLAALVRGGGSRDACGNPPRRADVVLSTAGLAGVHELDVEEGVVRVGAGTPLAALREATRGTGWELPLDPPGEAASVGGSLAAAWPGVRFARPRDAVLGLDLVLATGQRARCGGRVVKNVTGYDLAKIFVGSFGSLGVIEAAWLRLRPAPELTALRAVRLDPEQGAALALEASRRPAVRVAATADAALAPTLVPAARGPLLLLELAGDEAAVAVDDTWLREHGAAPVAADALEGLGALHLPEPCEPALRFRVSALASRTAAAAKSLNAAGARLHGYPGRGLLYARFDLASEADEEAIGGFFDAARRAAAIGRGAWLLESAPAAAKRGRDAFGDPAGALELMRALKQQYDPEGVLNPGRYAGGL